MKLRTITLPKLKSLQCSHQSKYKIPYHANKRKKLYYSKLWKAWIMDYYRDSSFPLDGWLKPCYFCNYITGNFIKYSYRKKALIIVPICRKCVTHEFSSKLEIYDEMNYQLRDYVFYSIPLNRVKRQFINGSKSKSGH